MEDDVPCQQVFHNDYIMIDILRMLNLKQQYELQKICRRLQYLVVSCVWAKDLRDIQMNQRQTGCLTKEEFFDFLQLNAINVTKLVINEADDDSELDKYMENTYENLLELRIQGFQLHDKDYLKICNNCCNLRSFRYDKKSTLCNEGSSKNDVWSLARRVPLDHLELYNVTIWRCQSSCLTNLKVLKIYTSILNYCSESLKLMENCPNLKELDISPSRALVYDFCANHRQLAKVRIGRVITAANIWNLLKHKKLKWLELDGFIEDGGKHQQNVRGYGKPLEVLKVNLTIFSNVDDSREDIWMAIFQSPRTNFENLQELYMKNQQTNDNFIRLLSIKCPQLRVLRLFHCAISGKYINQLKALIILELQYTSLPMPWIILCSILQDLKFLESLKLCQQNFAFEETTPPQYQKSLQELQVHVKGEQISVLQQVLQNCAVDLITLHIEDTFVTADILQNLFVETEQLHTLQLRGCQMPPNVKDIERLPFIKHLTFFNSDLQLNWSSILQMLKYSKVETMQIIDTPVYAAHRSCPLETDRDILSHLHSITVPYDIFRKKLPYWQWCFEESPKFQLCCFGHTDHRHVLNNLFYSSSLRNGGITSVYVNVGLMAIKCFCTEFEDTSAISVAWLDFDKLGIAKEFFANEAMIILIQ